MEQHIKIVVFYGFNVAYEVKYLVFVFSALYVLNNI